MNPCNLPPAGWRCTRIAGHEGPCAAIPSTPETQEIERLNRRITELQASGGELLAELERLRKENAELLSAIPARCPITGAKFFMVIDGCATYGGPFDSYTIPTFDSEVMPVHEREMSYRHYDHDEGAWKEGIEAVCVRIIEESALGELEEKLADLTARNAKLEGDARRSLAIETDIELLASNGVPIAAEAIQQVFEDADRYMELLAQDAARQALGSAQEGRK